MIPLRSISKRRSIMHSLKELFWTRVAKREDYECWNWTGNILNGYGRLKYKGRPLRAHRISWELFHNQKIPEGMSILHLCDNPRCVNPGHLYCGTQQDNMDDKKRRGRSSSDDLSLSHATLSAEIIILIRRCKNSLTAYGVEKELGVDRHVVTKIWNKIRYPSSDGYFVEFGGSYDSC